MRAELLKLLAARRASEVVQAMGESGFLEPILGGVGYTRRLSRLIAIEAERGLGADTLLRLAALGVVIPENAGRLRDRLHLANAEFERPRAAAEALISLHGIEASPSFQSLRALLFSAGREGARDTLRLAQAESEAPPTDEAFAAADRFLVEEPEPKLPITGADLIAQGVAAGRLVGRALRAFQALWIRAGFPKEPEMLAGLLKEAVAESGRAEAKEVGIDRFGSAASDPPRHKPDRPAWPKIQPDADIPPSKPGSEPHPSDRRHGVAPSSHAGDIIGGLADMGSFRASTRSRRQFTRAPTRGTPMKTQILAALGENGLQQASALNAGLAANDRIKYAFSLLQMAIEHARHPEQPATSLKRERLAAGIDDARLDAAVAGAQVVDKEVHIPGAAGIMERIEGHRQVND